MRRPCLLCLICQKAMSKRRFSPWATELHAVFEEAELQYTYSNHSSCSMNTVRRKSPARFEKLFQDIFVKKLTDLKTSRSLCELQE